MRCAALGLLVVCGCNQIFGIQTTTIDALGQGIDAPPDAPFLGSFLTWGIGTTTTTGQPAAIEFPPIGSEALHTERPTIQAGPPLSLGQLADENYNPDGSFTVPVFVGHPSRIVYRLPGDPVPHEIQWDIIEAHLVIPRTTRANAPLPPTGSGYDISPTGVPGAGFLAPTVWTSGVFTNTTLLNGERVGKRVTFGYAAHAQPLAGPPGSPEVSKGDWVMLLDWANPDASTHQATGYAYTKLDLNAGALTVPATQPAWTTTTTRFNPPVATGIHTNRMLAAMGGLQVVLAERMIVGFSPNAALVPFAPSVAAVETPLVLPLVERQNNDFNALTVLTVDPSQVPLEPVIYSSINNPRVTNGVTLTSSMQVMWPRSHSGNIYYPAAMATGEHLGNQPLIDENTANPVSKASNTFIFDFSPDSGMNVGADDYVVTLFEIAAGTATPLRTYQVLHPPIEIDRAMFQVGHKYVVATTAHRGYDFTNGKIADYRGVTLPFGSSTKFSAVFTIAL
jgi:hypothetical protein